MVLLVLGFLVLLEGPKGWKRRDRQDERLGALGDASSMIKKNDDFFSPKCKE